MSTLCDLKLNALCTYSIPVASYGFKDTFLDFLLSLLLNLFAFVSPFSSWMVSFSSLRGDYNYLALCI